MSSTTPVPQLTDLPFSGILDYLKQGTRCARAGWNGKGMYVYYVPPNSYPAVTDVAKKEFGDTVPYRGYLAMKTVDNEVVPWVASQTDLLAEDWTTLP